MIAHGVVSVGEKFPFWHIVTLKNWSNIYDQTLLCIYCCTKQSNDFVLIESVEAADSCAWNAY